jgi:aspartate ammonia-lyase
MTLGQEFEGFAVGIEDDRAVLHAVLPMLCETNMGATAVGTLANLIVGQGLMAREDVQILMAPARLSGEDSSRPKLSVEYRRDTRQCE